MIKNDGWGGAILRGKLDMDERYVLRWGWLAAIAGCAGVLGVLFGFIVFPKARPFPFTSPVRLSEGTARIGGPFTLTDPAGRRVSDRDFIGRPIVVSFGYTRDDVYSEAVVQVIARTIERLGPRSRRLSFLFVTLDPMQDTPLVLDRWLSQFHPQLIGLTGTDLEIATVANRYKVPFLRRTDATSPRGYSITFDPLIFLMNSQGLYMSHIDLDEGRDELVHRLEQLL